ncbi:uncharacterized protein LOC119847565 isoform X2 [Dermochelys coriacea]|uniref:uncharacterized protein LOC119847565 isoform X2 n=1 Tax=Dermochelys coriacea TaxID=27794 RepID=UPI001CA9EFC1|nr:uncharacterized protein LOC119847565 isoform X2 [Dermochelys coriacea]
MPVPAGTTRWRNTRPDRWATICLRLRPPARRTQANETKLSDGSSEDLEILDTDSSEGPNSLGLICFCPDPKPDAPQNAKTAGDAYSIGLYYLNLKEKFGIKPVQVRNSKTVMRAIVQAAVHGIIKHCLREKQNEDCPGCAIDAPGQRHHACVYWSLDDVNCKIKEISGSLCMESVLNIIIPLGHALQCLCLTQEHLALGAELVDKVTEAEDPNSVLDEIIKPTDKCLMQNVERLLRSANYKILLGKTLTVRECFGNKTGCVVK